MHGNTKLKDDQYGIILLEGKPTINGQIEARKKALLLCINGSKSNANIYPSMLEAWAIEHVTMILKLQRLKRNS